MTQWIMTGGFAAILFLATLRLPTIWRDAETADRTPQAWWVWGPRAWQALLRARPVGIIGGWWIVLAIATGSGLNDPTKTTGLTIVALIATLASLTAMALFVSVQLFARPKRLIPPALRSQRGLLSEWLVRHRRAA